MERKFYWILVNGILFICSIYGAAINNIIDDSNYSNGKFLENPVDKPRVVGGRGKIVSVSTKSSDISIDHKLSNDISNDVELSSLLSRLYDTLKDKADQENTEKRSEKKVEKPKSKKEDIKDLEEELNKVFQSISNEVKKDDHANTVLNEEKSVEKSNQFKDFAIVKDENDLKSLHKEVAKKDDKKKFISYKDFRKIFYQTFLNSQNDEKIQKIVLTGRKDSAVESKKKNNKEMEIMNESESDVTTNKKSITELYEELKHETKLEKEKYDEARLLERVKSEVDRQIKKEKTLENKKRELVSLLNEVTNGDIFAFQDGKVALRSDNRVSKDNEEDDFEKLLETTRNSELTQTKQQKFDAGKIFLDEFKKNGDKEHIENDTERSDNKRKKRLKVLLDEFVDILKETKSDQYHDGFSKEDENVENIHAKNNEAEKELMKVLEGFKIDRP